MHRCSCDICEFSSPHDYRPRHYYCEKGEFFNDQELRYNCSVGKICDWAYKEKYGVAYVMDLFEETASEIKKLRGQEEQFKEYFKQSTDELSAILNQVLEAELSGNKQLQAHVSVCTQPCAEKLKDIGFNVEELRGYPDNIIGYLVSWK